MDGRHPGERTLREAGGRAHRALAEARAGRQSAHAEAQEELAGHEAERTKLESGETDRPPAPHTRGVGVRDGRPGAALWQVTDFAAGLPDQQRAGLEAALEASGLLDAWITPRGELLEPGTHDVVALPGTTITPSLIDVLVPAIDTSDPAARTLTAEVLTRLLASIGCAESADGPYATCDGRWRLGPLHRPGPGGERQGLGQHAEAVPGERETEHPARVGQHVPGDVGGAALSQTHSLAAYLLLTQGSPWSLTLAPE